MSPNTPHYRPRSQRLIEALVVAVYAFALAAPIAIFIFDSIGEVASKHRLIFVPYAVPAALAAATTVYFSTRTTPLDTPAKAILAGVVSGLLYFAFLPLCIFMPAVVFGNFDPASGLFSGFFIIPFAVGMASPITVPAGVIGALGYLFLKRALMRHSLDEGRR